VEGGAESGAEGGAEGGVEEAPKGLQIADLKGDVLVDTAGALSLVGCTESLEMLEASLPTEDDDIDAFESLWSIVETLHGEEETKLMKDGLREKTGEWTSFEARSVVVRVLAWKDFVPEGLGEQPGGGGEGVEKKGGKEGGGGEEGVESL
jgi:hypothetical protein